MTEKTSLSLTLATEDIERIISETIKAQVAAAFAARGGDLASQVVSSFLFQGTDYRGSPTGRPAGRGETSYVNKIVSDSLQGSMREVVMSWIAENDAVLRKTVAAQLSKRRSDIANQIIESLIDSAKETYRCKVTVALGIPRGEE